MPFRALYGRDPPPILRYIRGAATVSEVDRELVDRDNIIDDLKMNWLRAQHRMKAQADLHRRDDSFDVGNEVYLKLRPYRQQSVARRRFEKLAARYYGPYKVAAKVGKVAYRLDLPASSKIHPVFHISQLRRALGTSHPASALPSELSGDLEMVVEPEELLGIRPNATRVGEIQVLIKWRGLEDFEATWENFDVVRDQFPSFHLEDKVAVWAGGIVRPPIRITYSRVG